MQIRELNTNSLNFDIVQFALAIALDHFGESKIAKSVLEYTGYGEYNGRTSEQKQEILKEREAAKKSCENLIVMRKLTDGTERPTKVNVVDATIEYFWNNKVLIRKVVGRPCQSRRNRFALRDAVNIGVKNKLYGKIMSLFYTHGTSKMIIAYMQTSMFEAEFHVALMKYIRQHGKYAAAVEPSTFHELLNNFRSYVDKYCSTEGSYLVSSANPNGYLFRDDPSKGGGPFTWYITDSNGKYFFDVLNRRGSAGIIGGDNMTYLDTISVDNNKSKPTINFQAICTKINTASRLLFSHIDSSIALYDIFSHYRDRKLDDRVTKLKKLKPIGFSLEFSKDFSEVLIGSEDTVREKINGRRRLCDVILRAFEKGIQREDIYSEIYLKLLEFTSTQSIKNGIRIFEVDGYRPKTKDLENSDKLRILIEGYLAMFKLVEYIEDLGGSVTVNNFPVDILRMAPLLVRFQSFDEYIANYREVVSLCNEVRAVSGRSQQIQDGLYNNDSVFSILSSHKILKTDPILSELLHANMDILHNAVQKYNATDDGEALLEGADYKLSILEDLSIVGSADVKEMSLADLNTIAYLNGLKIIKSYGSIQTRGISAFKDICEYAVILQEILEREGNPVVSSSGQYLHGTESLTEFPGITDQECAEMNTVLKSAGKNEVIVDLANLVRRLTIQTGISILFSNELPCGDPSKIKADWVEIRNFWCATGILVTFFNQLTDIMKKYKEPGKSIYLMEVKAAADSAFLRLLHKVEEASELYIFSEVSNTVKSTLADDRNTEEVIKLKKLSVVEAYNRLMDQLGWITEFSSYLLSRLDDTFKDFKPNVSYDSNLEILLEEASASISIIAASNPNMREVSQHLRTNYDTDVNGFIKNGSSKYVYNNDTYVHSFGYAVKVSILEDIEPDIIEVTPEIIGDLKRTVKPWTY